MRLVIGDSRPLVVEGLKLALGRSGIHVAAWGSSWSDVRRLAEATRPDLVTVQSCLWVEGARPNAPVVVVHGPPDPDRARCALAAGADAYVVETADPATLAVLLRELGAGTVLCAPRTRTANRLTDREREVLAAASRGSSTGEIARRIGVRPGTVKAHLARIYLKLGVSGRTEAALRSDADGSEDSPMGAPAVVATVLLMWDVLRWHDGTLSVAWWIIVLIAFLVLAAGGSRAARR